VARQVGGVLTDTRRIRWDFFFIYTAFNTSHRHPAAALVDNPPRILVNSADYSSARRHEDSSKLSIFSCRLDLM
jgi:hypothetical protein